MSDPTQTQIEVLDHFSSGPARLEAALAGLPSDALDLSVAPGEWSIRQTVHHLADDGDVWCLALKKAIATPGAPMHLEGFPGNEVWAAQLRAHERPIDGALALITAHVRVMSDLLHDFPAAWDNAVSILDEQGRVAQQVTCGQMIGFLGEHMDNHIAVIQSIRKQHSKC
jgi:hypothetical protein